LNRVYEERPRFSPQSTPGEKPSPDAGRSFCWRGPAERKLGEEKAGVVLLAAAVAGYNGEVAVAVAGVERNVAGDGTGRESRDR
jgi:hypothetical protein